MGLMGPIASGKSAVADCLQEHGIPIVDADKITHELQSDPGGAVHKKLIAEFGGGILGADGVVDRQKLGAVVFDNPEKLRALNGIMHGAIMREIVCRTMSLALRGHRKIFWDIPLLAVFLQKQPRLWRWILSAVVVVIAPPDVQKARLMARNQLTEEEAQKRMDLQLSASKQRELANIVIENDGSLTELRGKVAAFLNQDPRGVNICEAYGVIIGATVFATWMYGFLAGAGALAGCLLIYCCFF